MVNIVTLKDGSQYVCDVAFGGDGPTTPLPLKDDVVALNLGTQEIRYTRARILQSTPKPFAETQNGVSPKLIPGHDNISPSEFPPGAEDDPFTFWVYQYRNKSDAPWNSYYIFQTTPYMYLDFRSLSFAASTAGPNGGSPFQTTTVLTVKFLRHQGESKIYGKRMMVNNVIKETVNKTGPTRVLYTCRTEQERIQALKEYFGITLTEEEVEGIRGRITEIR
jgi:arylamine N-acetyltransferase